MKVPAYNVGLSFYYPSSVHTSQMDVSISAGTEHIPLVVSGSLKVGHIFARFMDATAN